MCRPCNRPRRLVVPANDADAVVHPGLCRSCAYFIYIRSPTVFTYNGRKLLTRVWVGLLRS